MIRSARFQRPVRAALGAVLAAAVTLLAGAASASSEHAIELQPSPLFGADIRSLVFDPANAERALAGSSAGHVYRSDDGGATWANAGVEIPFAGWVVGALEFDPDRPARLWAALWGIWGGGMLALSDDLGSTWELRSLGEFASDQVYTLARVPGAPGRIFAGTRSGVLLSEDDGATWRASGRGVPGLVHVSSLHVDRNRPRTVIAGTWRRAYRSDDGGATWRGIFDGMALDSEVFSLHPVPGRDGELWASTCGWIYRAQAWGERWTRHQRGLAERRTPSFRVLSPERLLAGTVAGSFLSTDGGASFRRTSSAELAVLAIAHHPARPERVLLGTEGSGVWVSTDGGASFVARPVGLRNVRVPALAKIGDQVFAALAHAGPSSGVFRSPDGGISFEPSPAAMPTVLDLAAIDGHLYAATERGLYERTPNGWRSQPQVGDRRVEELAVTGRRLAVRTAGALYTGGPEGSGLRLEPLTLPRASSRTAASERALGVALTADALWVQREDGLFRWSGGPPVAASLPFPGGRVEGAAGHLLYAGGEGVFRRDGASGAWIEIERGARRLLPTGDARFQAVTVSAAGASLFDAELGVLRRIATPFPPSETLSALAVGDRLFLGTSGYGLWEGRLPE